MFAQTLRLFLLLLLPSLAGSAPELLDARLVQRGERPQLDLDLRLQLPQPIWAAVEHGVPVVLVARLEAHGVVGWFGRAEVWQGELRSEIRYRPLSRRWQVSESPGDRIAQFRSHAALLAHLEQWRGRDLGLDQLPAAASHWSIELHLDLDALPAPLRLPALFDADWRWRLPRSPVQVGAAL